MVFELGECKVQVNTRKQKSFLEQTQLFSKIDLEGAHFANLNHNWRLSQILKFDDLAVL